MPGAMPIVSSCPAAAAVKVGSAGRHVQAAGGYAHPVECVVVGGGRVGAKTVDVFQASTAEESIFAYKVERLGQYHALNHRAVVETAPRYFLATLGNPHAVKLLGQIVGLLTAVGQRLDYFFIAQSINGKQKNLEKEKFESATRRDDVHIVSLTATKEFTT